MELAAALFFEHPDHVAGLEEMLLQEGIPCRYLGAIPEGGSDATVELVFLDGFFLDREGKDLLERIRVRLPAALVCVVTPFAHPQKLYDYFSWGLWDALYLPPQRRDLLDLIEKSSLLLERQRSSARPRKILVVDDEVTMREACTALLTQSGHLVESASDGAEALTRLQDAVYDLVITDNQMPGMSGLALLGRIKSGYPELPVIMFSGHASIDTAVASLRSGVADFILKPFTSQDFLRIVERVLGVQKLVQENRLLAVQAREDKIRLGRQHYELRILAEALAEMSTLLNAEDLAACWLRSAFQLVDFALGAFLITGPPPGLTLLADREDEMLSGLALEEILRRYPPLLASVSMSELQIRRLRKEWGQTAALAAASLEFWVHPLTTTEFLGIVLVARDRAAPFTAEEKSFLANLTRQSGQLFEKLQALQSQEKLQMEAMVASMHHGILLTDLEGKILVINEAARTLLALQRSSDARDLAHLRRERHFPLDEYVTDLLRSGGTTISREYLVRAPREMVVNLDLTVVMSGKGEAIGVVTLLRDITELREVDRMKSEFVSIVSHEIRTPLTTIKNCNSIILKGLTGAINEKQERFLKMSQECTDRLTKLVNDLLDLSRIETGKMILEIKAVDLGELLSGIVLETEHLLAQKEIDLARDLPPQPLIVFADPDRLRQVFLNLLQNALKFSEPRTRIRIAVAELPDGGALPAEILAGLPQPLPPLAEVRVEDQGVGIPPEALEKIFDKFQQLEHTLQRETGGIGLGLPISRGIMQSHRGAIWAERRPEGGSVFRVVLPRDRRSAVVKEEEA